MSKTWYPIIDYDKCSGCLACYEKCTHGVYELNSRNFPKVVLPEGCVQGCKGCGSLCPLEAISYHGDSLSTNDSCCDGQEKSSCCQDLNDSKDNCCGDSEKEDKECCSNDVSTDKETECGCSCGCN